MFMEDLRPGYDPFISGLEPEPFENVLLDIFEGIKRYMDTDDEEDKPEEEEPLSKDDPWYTDENLFDRKLCTDVSSLPQLDFLPLTPPLEIPPPEPTPPKVTDMPKLKMEVPVGPVTKTRQFPMLRCGCNEDFVSQFALEHHETKHHPQFFNWFCSECNIRFKALQQASDHLIMIHGCGRMPVFGNIHDPVKKPSGQLLGQIITRRSSDFISEFLETRGKQTIMTTAYYLFAKCELQAVVAGNVSLACYNEAKSDLLTTADASEFEDLISCLKSTFIYGRYIKRVPLEGYMGSTTIYKTLTYTNVRNRKKPTPHQSQSMRAITGVAGTRQQFYGAGQYRVNPYTSMNQARTAYKKHPTPPSRNQQYVLPLPNKNPQTVVRRTPSTTNTTTTSKKVFFPL